MIKAFSNSRDAWPSPAKLNLFLHITGRRHDGYHLLQTVFQLLNIGDELTFQITADPTVERTYTLEGVTPEQDIIVRAAKLLQHTAGIRQGVRIGLFKQMPIGGGLGSGSSTAATTLVALNHLWKAGLDVPSLARLGLMLGADVPVFVRGTSAWAEGVGEHLEPIELPPRWYVVLIPGVSISTAKVFADPQLRRDCPAITIRDFLAGRAQPGNVCEPCVRDNYPQVAAALEALSAFSPARLTGTGSSVFAAFESEHAAQLALNALGASWNGFVARGVNRSPLLDRLATAQVQR